MKVNLHTLACQLARRDGKTTKRGYDESVIGAETTLKSLGQHLRDCTTVEALATVNAIVERAGKK